MLRVECGKLNNVRSKGLLEALKMSLGESRVEITGCSIRESPANERNNISPVIVPGGRVQNGVLEFTVP